MNYKVIDFGRLYCIFVENEAVFGFDRAMMSLKLDCRDFEYGENGIILYGCEPNGLLRSHNVLTLSKESAVAAMHDGKAEIKPLNGSRIVPTEGSKSYSFTCIGGENRLTLELSGSCRYEENTVVFRRGMTEIRLSEPTVNMTPNRRGFEYEADKCLSLIGEIKSERELLPLLLLENGIRNAVLSENRIETVETLIPSLSDGGKITAKAVLDRYCRAFGYEKKER